MDEDIHTRFKISFEENFDTHMLPWGAYRPTGIHIEVDGTLISSRSKDVYNVDDYIDANLKKMLRAVVKIAGGELARVPFWAVPLELRFFPAEDVRPDAVRVSLIHGDGRSFIEELPDEGVLVSTEAVIEEILRVSREFLQAILESNPDFGEKDHVQEFEDALESAEEAYGRYKSDRETSGPDEN
jgi:hypothetical protein